MTRLRSPSPDVAPPRIKVCCIADIDEARLAIDAGTNAIGLVSDEMPSGTGTIAHEQIAQIARSVPREIETFLLTCRTDPSAIIDLAKQAGCSTVQLCDAVDGMAGAYVELRAGLPGVRLVQVIHVEDELALDEAYRTQAHVDALLLDSGRPKAAVKQLGGTGRAHDWTISHRIVGMANVPVWLAGGLNPTNVAEAVRSVRPHGLDVCTGVRTDGKLDGAKLRAFIETSRAAGAS